MSQHTQAARGRDICNKIDTPMHDTIYRPTSNRDRYANTPFHRPIFSLLFVDLLDLCTAWREDRMIGRSLYIVVGVRNEISSFLDLEWILSV